MIIIIISVKTEKRDFQDPMHKFSLVIHARNRKSKKKKQYEMRRHT